MRNKKQLALKQLERKLAPFRGTEKVERPSRLDKNYSKFTKHDSRAAG